MASEAVLQTRRDVRGVKVAMGAAPIGEAARLRILEKRNHLMIDVRIQEKT